jgi:putative nucleotidyltransferase with HDIG domain
MINVLIVDDEEYIRDLLRQILEMYDYNCTLAADAAEAREYLKGRRFELVLCDIGLPGESGLDFIQHVLREYKGTAAIMVTAMDDPTVAEFALDSGVYDYVIKPFERNSVLISVANALRRRQLEIDNLAYRESLEKMVSERTSALLESMEKQRKALDGIIHAMALTVEMRDPYTAGHQQRVAQLATAIAKEMGLSRDQLNGLRMAAMIHDMGKIAVPAEILSKPGSINEIEFNLLRSHPKVGYDILKTIDFPWPIARMVLQHHERMDGSGYPSGLKGDEILLEARILSVCDVVESMASYRPYRPAIGLDKALEEISRNRGVLYDASVVNACLEVFAEKDFSFE